MPNRQTHTGTRRRTSHGQQQGDRPAPNRQTTGNRKTPQPTPWPQKQPHPCEQQAAQATQPKTGHRQAKRQRHRKQQTPKQPEPPKPNKRQRRQGRMPQSRNRSRQAGQQGRIDLHQHNTRPTRTGQRRRQTAPHARQEAKTTRAGNGNRRKRQPRTLYPPRLKKWNTRNAGRRNGSGNAQKNHPRNRDQGDQGTGAKNRRNITAPTPTNQAQAGREPTDDATGHTQTHNGHQPATPL
jgi:hypothetical protein